MPTICPTPHALPRYKDRSPRSATVLGWLLFIVLLLALVALLPPGLPRPRSTATLLALGVVGTWRWSWGALHLLRALLYKHIVFPRLRHRARGVAKPPSLYVVVTSYRMSQALNAAVYGRIFDEIARFGVPTFLVACVTDPADATLINERFTRRVLPEGTRVHIIAQRGRGKRDAMAEALKAIAALHPPAGAHVALMDGDTLLSEGAFARSCAMLTADGTVGAVTTDNIPLVQGSAFTREWYRVRMAHRDSLMASMALSRRLLVLTGRFSVFRADLATSNRFINAIEQDSVEHGRLGRIRMLTGDDKSTWFETLRSGWAMLYLPDVVVYPVEELPAGGFMRASTALMLRWYGNMVRNNGRALRLGPARCGAFVWTSLLDQRVSMWTSLVGPSSALVLALTRHGSFLVAYLIWVLLSRALVCAFYWVVTGRFHPLFIVTLYYNQVVGAAIKIFASYHPDRQKWTRQQAKGGGSGRRSLAAGLSTPLMWMTVGGFVLIAVAMVGTPDGHRARSPATSLVGALTAPLRPVPAMPHPGP